MHKLALCVVMLSLAGCGQTLLTKPGYTPHGFNADKFDCEQKVVTMYGGYSQMGPGHAILAGGDIKNCMFAKGYTEVRQ